MNIREKNEVTKSLISSLEKSEAKTWSALAGHLNRPRRVRHEVSVARISKLSGKAVSVVVPGVVLGRGEIGRKIDIAALKFSGSARESIEKAGGKAMSIEEMFKSRPKAKGVMIMG